MIIHVIWFILGTFIGSFLNVLTDRLPNDENPFKGRSHCDNCQKRLAPIDLIPLLSFAFLRGKCRYCKAKLSWYYPLIEATTGLLFVLTYFLFSWGFELIYALVIVSGLIVIFFSDLKYGIIPNKIVILGILITFFWLLINNQSSIVNHLVAALGSFLFFIIIFLITRGRGMGFGDVKFAFWIGLILGFPLNVVALYLAFLTGAIVSIILVLIGKKRFKKSTIAFGPFLVLGTLLSIYFGPNITEIFTGILQIK